MTTLPGRLRTSKWTVPLLAGALIVASWATGGRGGSGIGNAFMLAAAIVAGARILISAVGALRVRTIGIDLLVSVAAIGAIFLGNYWEAAAVTTLFAIGHALEQVTLARTRAALSDLVETAPDVAIVLRDGVETEVAASQVTVGEIVVVKAGAVVPVDGQVDRGEAAINEASITGESIPAAKGPGDAVYAGTVATDGYLRVRTSAIGSETTLARIIRRVEDAQDAKARTQAFMDRFSKWYTPAIIVLAIVSGLVSGNLELALTLLVIGCPGALVISIPVSIVAGIGRGARDGVLIKGGEHLERAARIDTVAFDKTGTLTQGRPVLTDVVVLDPGLGRDELLGLAARAELGSQHPLARPIVEAARALGLDLDGADDEFTPVVGHGIVATVSGRRVVVGKPELAAQTFPGIDVEDARRGVDDLGRQGRTAMVVAADGHVLGLVAVADTLRPGAAEAVAALRAAGVTQVVMLTGDRDAVARAVAAQVGITDVRAGLLPEDKLQAIADLQSGGATVAMVGDGVNDAPALATADTGIAMGAAGSGLAVETADIALMTDRLDRVAHAVVLARSTVSVMRQNIGVALVTVALLLAGVFAGGVTMSIGMLVHEASVLLVIGNAMRLLRLRAHHEVAATPRLPDVAASAVERESVQFVG
ncbi:cation-translocating P-type ATPase [Tessaracoccus sp. SD287]|uniref:heavy metal translocating P-type ATPase n=1 Tax=Tessaracoccus sp. SD287 TaxID=2782008 RepID=UPI001A9681A5|nr:cation-translocating P-type ATPase [Tessaracoccus sp. SD287]MBO1030793.1 cation-translocating P-type ATPase [Tessaracoccus sp. SD287]